LRQVCTLVLVAIDLLGYVLWRFIPAIKDPENKGTDAEFTLQHLGYAGNGLIYAKFGLGLQVIVLGSGSGGNSNSRINPIVCFSQPFGLVGTIGAL